MLCVLANSQNQFDIGQRRQQGFTPGSSAFRARRKVTAFARARVAKTHSGDGDFSRVVECRFIDAHPLPQAIAAGVIKGDSRLVYTNSRCLSCHQNFRRSMYLEDWIGAQGQ